MQRRTLFDSPSLRVGHIVARPRSAGCGEIEQSPVNVLALPLAGVFAKHDGPGRHVIATASHAVFVAANTPYRLSFPGCIGDSCLTLQWSAAALANVLPESMAGEGFHPSINVANALLPPSLMVARNLLWKRVEGGQAEALEIEEASLGLLDATVRIARGGQQIGSVDSTLGRRRLQVERVKEAICTQPDRRWTLGELAERAHASPFHLTRVFRAEMGISIHRYVLHARMAGTLDAVLEPRSDLTEIALASGFASHSHFTARFREFFGVTPSVLRRRSHPATTSDLRKIVTAFRKPAA